MFVFFAFRLDCRCPEKEISVRLSRDAVTMVCFSSTVTAEFPPVIPHGKSRFSQTSTVGKTKASHRDRKRFGGDRAM